MFRLISLARSHGMCLMVVRGDDQGCVPRVVPLYPWCPPSHHWPPLPHGKIYKLPICHVDTALQHHVILVYCGEGAGEHRNLHAIWLSLLLLLVSFLTVLYKVQLGSIVKHCIDRIPAKTGDITWKYSRLSSAGIVSSCSIDKIYVNKTFEECQLCWPCIWKCVMCSQLSMLKKPSSRWPIQIVKLGFQTQLYSVPFKW